MTLFSKLNQIKDLRQQAKELQNVLNAESVTVENNGLNLTMNGQQKITALSITPEFMQPGNEKRLASDIISLHNKATEKIQKILAEKAKETDIFKNFANLK